MQKNIKNNSKANILNKNVLNSEIWNENSIKKRAKNLAKILIDKFKYENLHDDTALKMKNSYHLDINSDFSNTKPYEFLFVGELTKVNSWVDLLRKTINISYNLASEHISDLATKNFSIPNSSRVYISNNKEILRKPIQIGNSGIYFETNLSANNIVSFIRALMINMELDLLEDFAFLLKETL